MSGTFSTKGTSVGSGPLYLRETSVPSKLLLQIVTDYVCSSACTFCRPQEGSVRTETSRTNTLYYEFSGSQ